jgi:hypothetical protein
MWRLGNENSLSRETVHVRAVIDEHEKKEGK